MTSRAINIPESSENNLLLENLQGGIVYSDFDPPFHLRYVTVGMARMSGYTQEELTSMVQMDIVWDEDVDSLGEEVARQFAISDVFEVEYRLKRKDGTYIYVLDRAKVVTHDDGNKYIHCMITDITDLKRMEQALRLSEEKYKLAIRQSGNVILEYDLITKAVHFSDNFRDVFGCEAPADPLGGGWVAPQHMEALEALFDEVLRHKEPAAIELVVRTACDTLAWASVTLGPVVISGGRVHALVGCLQNIDVRKRELEELTELSQKDGLTGVYNRVTMESMITERLEQPDGTDDSALIIIDIDYFKAVNDRLGHATGDRVLIHVAQIIADHLPQEALFGRLGGDEFLIFAPATGNDELAQLCEHILGAVRTAFAADEYPVTVSIGGVRCTTARGSFHALYRSADIALYTTKGNGRNGYTVFGA